MQSYLLKRLLRAILTIWGGVTLTFVLGRISGDPLALMLPETATQSDYAALRQALGLDGTLIEQYQRYLWDVVHGNFGTSIVSGRSAFSTVAERIPATAALTVPVLFTSVGFGVPLGVCAALCRQRWCDRLIRVLSLVGQSVPSFVVGILLIFIFGVLLNVLPTFGDDTLLHALLPVVTLSLYPLALITRLTRTAMLEVLDADYIRTARAKGLHTGRVYLVHALRNALLPIVTVIGLQSAALLSGAAIVETVFAWPGIGLLAVRAVGGRDFPVLQVIVLFSAFVFVSFNLLIDLLYSAIDPRIGLEK